VAGGAGVRPVRNGNHHIEKSHERRPHTQKQFSPFVALLTDLATKLRHDGTEKKSSVVEMSDLPAKSAGL